MTLDRPRELIPAQPQFGGGSDRNAGRLLTGGMQRGHGLSEVDALSRELDLEPDIGLKSGTGFTGIGRSRVRVGHGSYAPAPPEQSDKPFDDNNP